MLRKLAFLTVLAMIVAVAFGAAASLDVFGGAIQYGMDVDLTCDADGVQVFGWGLETDNNIVYYVRIGDVDPACEGNEMFVRVEDGSNGLLGSGKVTILASEPVDGYKIDLNPDVYAHQIEVLKVWIEGPAP